MIIDYKLQMCRLQITDYQLGNDYRLELTKQETRNKKQEARNKKQEARSKKPETRNKKPGTRNPEPETRNKKLYHSPII